MSLFLKNTVALHVTGYPVNLLIATRNNFMMGMMGLLRPKYARVLWVFLQIRTIKHSPDSFEQFCSGSRRKLDASRKFFQLRNQGLSKSLFSTAILLALLENLLRWREGRISPSPHDMHTLWKERTRRKAAESRRLTRTLLRTPTCGQQEGKPRERRFFLNNVKAPHCLILLC